MKDQKNMYQRIKQEELRSSISKILYRITYIKIGVSLRSKCKKV